MAARGRGARQDQGGVGVTGLRQGAGAALRPMVRHRRRRCAIATAIRDSRGASSGVEREGVCAPPPARRPTHLFPACRRRRAGRRRAAPGSVRALGGSTSGAGGRVAARWHANVPPSLTSHRRRPAGHHRHDLVRARRPVGRDTAAAGGAPAAARGRRVIGAERRGRRGWRHAAVWVGCGHRVVPGAWSGVRARLKLARPPAPGTTPPRVGLSRSRAAPRKAGAAPPSGTRFPTRPARRRAARRATSRAIFTTSESVSFVSRARDVWGRAGAAPHLLLQSPGGRTTSR